MRGSRSEVVLFFCVVGNCVPYDTKASGGRRTLFMAEKPAYPAPQTSLLYVAESGLSVTLRSGTVFPWEKTAWRGHIIYERSAPEAGNGSLTGPVRNGWEKGSGIIGTGPHILR